MTISVRRFDSLVGIEISSGQKAEFLTIEQARQLATDILVITAAIARDRQRPQDYMHPGGNRAPFRPGP